MQEIRTDDDGRVYANGQVYRSFAEFALEQGQKKLKDLLVDQIPIIKSHNLIGNTLHLTTDDNCW